MQPFPYIIIFVLARPLPRALSISQRGPLTPERPTTHRAIHVSRPDAEHVSFDILLLLAAEVEPSKLSPTSVTASLFLVLLTSDKGREVQWGRVGGSERGSWREREVGSGGGGGGGSRAAQAWAVFVTMVVVRVFCRPPFAGMIGRDYSLSRDGDVDVKLLRSKGPQVGPSNVCRAIVSGDPRQDPAVRRPPGVESDSNTPVGLQKERAARRGNSQPLGKAFERDVAADADHVAPEQALQRFGQERDTRCDRFCDPGLIHVCGERMNGR